MQSCVKRLAIVSINSDIFSESHYVLHLLDAISDSSALYVCVSVNMEPAFLQEIKKYTHDIFKFDSYMDINRWSSVWISRYEEIEKEYKEVIFVNDSLYGPLYPLSEVFDVMDNREVDFWGITAHGKIKRYDKAGEEWPRFIQTYFWGVRRNLFCSAEFNRFMQKQGDYKSLDKAAEGFEYLFTEKFESLGYKWSVYIDTQTKENQDSEFYISYILFDIYNMISKRRYPFLPKVLFDLDCPTIQKYNDGNDLWRTLQFIRENTDYDVDLIIQNVIKRINLHDLMMQLNLNYVVTPQRRWIPQNKKYAVFAHLFYEDLFEYSISMLLNVPLCFDIYISTGDVRKKALLEEELDRRRLGDRHSKISICVFEPRGRDLSALLVGFREKILLYDVACFIHDKKSNQMNYSTVGENFNNHLWENMLKSREYICEILNLLEKDKYLGLLCPPMVFHSTYFHTAFHSWTICFEKTLQVARQLGIDINISQDKNPVALGSVFWFKTTALRQLFTYPFQYSDFPAEPMAVDGTVSHALERIFPYVAQAAGFYSGNILTKELIANQYAAYREALTLIMREIDKFAKVNTADLESTLYSLQNMKAPRKHKGVSQTPKKKN